MVNVIPEENRFADPDNVSHKIREFIQLKNSLEDLETRQKELRAELLVVIDEQGYEDDKGNIQFDLDSPILGVQKLEKRRRVTRKIDEEVATAIIDEKGIGDEVYKLVQTIDEDALMAAFYEEKITEEELDQMFPQSITWALMTKK